MKRTRFLAPLAVAALLAACGGGGSDAPASATPPAATPVATTLSIPLSTAFANFVNLSRTSGLTVVGTASSSGQTLNLTGSGTYSEIASAGSFEGTAGVRKTITVNGNLVGTSGGQSASAPLASTSDAYFDSNYKPLGGIATGSYCVTTSYTAPPATGQVGTQGNWYGQDCYASSAKTSKLATVTAKYALEADTATSVLLKITTTATASGTSLPAIATYRVTSTGAVTHISDATTTTLSGVAMNLTITYQ